MTKTHKLSTILVEYRVNLEPKMDLAPFTGTLTKQDQSAQEFFAEFIAGNGLKTRNLTKSG